MKSVLQEVTSQRTTCVIINKFVLKFKNNKRTRGRLGGLLRTYFRGKIKAKMHSEVANVH